MSPRLQRFIVGLDVEERILNGAALFAIISIFLPWLSGEWLGEEAVTYSGFEFFTSFIGMTMFVMLLCLIAITVAPIFGLRLFHRTFSRDVFRLCLASQTAVLSIIALSVLTKITYDYTRLEIRFGIYCTLIGSLIATFYAFWKMQSNTRQDIQEIFQHPDDINMLDIRIDGSGGMPPPPPPRPLEPEEHRLHR